MEQQISTAGAILLICIPTYRRRVESKEPPGLGKGVCWEANLIYNQLYSDKQHTNRFVPVLLPGTTENDIPRVLQGQAFFRVQDEEGYESLYRRLRLINPRSPWIRSVRFVKLPQVDVESLFVDRVPAPKPSQGKTRKFFILYPQGCWQQLELSGLVAHKLSVLDAAVDLRDNL